MHDINIIREKIAALFSESREIHVDVHSTKPKLHISGAAARITGVYKNLFTLETLENGLKKIYTVQYTDLFIGKVRITELEQAN